MPEQTAEHLKVGDRVYVGNETRHGTIIEITSNGSTRILFDRSGQDVLFPKGDAKLLPIPIKGAGLRTRSPKSGEYTYVCVNCNAFFARKTKLDESRYVPRCPTCHAQDRKASKRQTWRDHSEQYYANRKAAKQSRKETQADLEEDTAPPEPELTRQAPEAPENVPHITLKTERKRVAQSGRPILRRLPNGRQIVWMADSLSS
jgi:DNA-directed RNA polymerase subunit RPC12/RpoP